MEAATAGTEQEEAKEEADEAAADEDADLDTFAKKKKKKRAVTIEEDDDGGEDKDKEAVDGKIARGRKPPDCRVRRLHVRFECTRGVFDVRQIVCGWTSKTP